LQTESYATIVTVTVPSGSPTDKRLDDLNRKVDAGFVRVEGDIRDLRNEMNGLKMEFKGECESLRTEVKGEIDGLRTEMKVEIEGLRTEMKGEIHGLRTELKSEMSGLRDEMKAEVGGLRGEMNARFEAMEARFDSLQRTLLGGAVAIVVALIGSSALG
jgi:hypothetical protein